MSGLSVAQFRRFVVRPTLERLDLWSSAAERLVLGTAVHESDGLRFIDQRTSDDDDETLGPAYGLYQIEPATHRDLLGSFLRYRPPLAERLGWFLAADPDRDTQLATNLAYATAVCRLIYYRASEPLPAAEDLMALARYWKRHFNTAAGKGTAAQFLLHFQRHIGEG